LYGLGPDDPRIKKHVDEGGVAITLDEKKCIVILDQGNKIPVENVENVPLTIMEKQNS